MFLLILSILITVAVIFQGGRTLQAYFNFVRYGHNIAYRDNLMVLVLIVVLTIACWFCYLTYYYIQSR